MAEPATSELAPAAPDVPRVLTALQHRDFRYMWLGNFLSNIGTWMQNVAQGWLVLQLTDSAYWLGVVSFVAAAPMLVFTTLGGAIADHVDRRKMLINTQIAMMCSAFILALLTYERVVTVPHILVLAFVTGIAASLAAPAHQALVPQLVPRKHLAQAVGINSAQFNLSRVIGPTVGGFSMAWFGVAGNFLLNGFSFLAVIFALRQMHYPAQSAIPEGSLWLRMQEGFAHVYRDSRMRVLVQIVCIGSLLAMPYFSFIPVFARDILHVGERGLGILMAFSGLGAFFAAITIAYIGKPRHRGQLILYSGSVFFASVIGFTFSRWFLLSAALQFTAGYAIIIMVAIINTRLQLMASDDMRGRIMSIYATAYLGLPPIGAFIAGWLSQWMTAPHAIASMAGVGLLLFLIALGTNHELRKLD
jgi:MFS family permease